MVGCAACLSKLRRDFRNDGGCGFVVVWGGVWEFGGRGLGKVGRCGGGNGDG